MNPESKIQINKNTQVNGFACLFKKLVTWISNLFKPEEVEVTFKVEGKKVRYTYKVMHKQVA